MSFKLPELSYGYSDLEPHIDARTMEIHHSKHHAGYTNNLNNAIKGTEFEHKPIEEILQSSNLSPAITTPAAWVAIFLFKPSSFKDRSKSF